MGHGSQKGDIGIQILLHPGRPSDVHDAGKLFSIILVGLGSYDLELQVHTVGVTIYHIFQIREFVDLFFLVYQLYFTVCRYSFRKIRVIISWPILSIDGPCCNKTHE